MLVNLKFKYPHLIKFESKCKRKDSGYRSLYLFCLNG